MIQVSTCGPALPIRSSFINFDLFIAMTLKVHFNKKGEREIGESWSYLGVSTFVPIFVVKKAEEAIMGLDKASKGYSAQKGAKSYSHCGKA